MKECKSCFEIKDDADFTKDKNRPDGLYLYCKMCKREKDKERYTGETVSKNRERVRVRAQKHYDKIVEIKSSTGCLICSEREPCCLEFHHLDPNEKEFEVAKNPSRSWENIESEMKKCIVVCSNCHRKIHAGIIQL